MHSNKKGMTKPQFSLSQLELMLVFVNELEMLQTEILDYFLSVVIHLLHVNVTQFSWVTYSA